jgi:hypothetical protein
MSWKMKMLEGEVRFMIQEIQNTQERAVWDPEEDEWRAENSELAEFTTSINVFGWV